MVRMISRAIGAALLVAAQTGILGAQNFTVAPAELTFQLEVGEAPPPNRTFRIESSPAGQAFAARVKAGLVNPGWLSLLPTNGQTPADVSVAVDSAGFDRPGTQTAEVEVTVGGETKIVLVRVEIAPASSPPTIAAAPGTLAFAATNPGVLPPAQQLVVSNPGGGILHYQLAVRYPQQGPQGWLAVSPANGAVSFNTRSHAVTVPSTAALDPGQYAAEIVVTAIGAGATNSPLAVPVTLSIGARPLLTATPSTLAFAASEGGAFPAIQTFTIANSGGGTVRYSIAGDQPWLFVQPAQGDTGSGPVVHRALPDIRGLAQGVYTGNLVVTSPSLERPFNVPVRLTIGPPSSLFVLPTRLDFVGNTGISPRERREISIVNTPLAPGRWTARVVQQEATWLKVSPAAGQIPARLQVEVDTGGLGAAALEAEIEIRAREGDAPPGLSPEGEPRSQAVVAVRVPVRLTVASNAPAMDAAPRSLLFQPGGGRTVESQSLIVDNTGGPQLNWQGAVETDDGGGWLRATPLNGTAPTRLRVTADATGLAPGVYHGRIRAEAGDRRVTVPVAMVAPGDGPVLDPDATGLYWEAVQDGPLPAPQGVTVLNRGSGGASWTANTVGFTGTQTWLALAPAAGFSTPETPGSFSAAPSYSGLVPGLYHGLVEIRGTAENSPRTITAALRIVPAAETPARTVTPGGVVFVAQPGAAPALRSATVRRNRAGAASFVAGASTEAGGDWLSVTPSTGAASEKGAVELSIAADPAGLAPGFYRGQVGVTFGDGLVEAVSALLVVRPAAACSAAALAVAPIEPARGFRAWTALPTRVEAEVLDNCGQPVEDAAVLATFNAGEPALALERVGPGRYAATWGPTASALQATVAVIASTASASAQAAVVGSVADSGASVPALSRGGVVGGASFASGEAIAPGAIVSVFGRNFLADSVSAASVPLPRQLAGVRLLLGGAEAPLFFKNFGQINAQAPYEMLPNTTAQAIVRAGPAYSLPEEVAVAAARPGVFVLPASPGRAIAQNQDGSLNSPANPARRGQAIVVYLSGVGAVDPPVATGAAAPGAPLSWASLPVSATVGGQPAEVFFLGLSPGWVGLAQANIIVPADAPLGPDTPLRITVGGQSSRTLAVAVGATP